jgi:hypothetical protein
VLPAARARQKGEDSQNGTARTRQPENSQDGIARTRKPEQDKLNRTDRTGLPLQDCHDSTARTGWSKQDSLCGTARTGQSSLFVFVLYRCHGVEIKLISTDYETMNEKWYLF